MDAEYKILSLCKDTELVLFTDGSYALRYADASGKYSDTTSLSLIQCYSNGCINKVSVSDLIALRYNYKYSHGIYPLSDLLASSIVSKEDIISVKYMRNKTERTASIDVQTLRSHSMLGLKGINITGTSFDEITGWYVNGDLISCHSENKKLVNPNEQTILKNIADDTPNVISDLSKVENNDNLKELFSSYLKSGRDIPTGQKHAKEVLAHCQSREKFWYVIRTLFKCNTHIYRSPVVEYLNEDDISQFIPSIEILSSICEQLFSVTAKPEKNLEFLYHFKDILTDEIKDKLIMSINSLSLPSLYLKLCDTVGMNVNELIEYCIKQSNAAAYYCIYEILLNVYQKEGYIVVSKLIDTYINNLEDISIEGVLIKRLIYSEFKKKKNNIDTKVAKIKARGFGEYSRLCASHEGKKKTQAIQDSITSNVGKMIEGKYVATYSNHYFLITSNGIRILLPKSMAEEVLYEGDSANVQIVYADKKYNTLYATQKVSIDYKKITQIPLLNNGDIIEISFDLYGNPVPHKCDKKIKVCLKSYTKEMEIEYKERYKAKVIRQTSDKYHYLIKIIE
ncbi:MAG: hypothetical protein LUD00_05510 [Prevotellaceae bacterium]|nr:hypothetical protein [Prevotellaceae bacterium]